MQVTRRPGRGAPVLGELDHDEPAERGAVDRVVQVDPAWFQDARGLTQDGRDIADMLEHVSAAGDVGRGVRERQLLTASQPVVDREASSLRMSARGLQRRRRRVNADDVRAEPGQFLGEQPPAAADVRQRLPGGIDAGPPEHLLQVAQPHRVQRGADHAQRLVISPPDICGRVVDLVAGWHLPSCPPRLRPAAARRGAGARHRDSPSGCSPVRCLAPRPLSGPSLPGKGGPLRRRTLNTSGLRRWRIPRGSGPLAA